MTILSLYSILKQKLEVKKLPFYMRRRYACPDCGWVPDLADYHYFEIELEEKSIFICPRCKVEYLREDFYEENIFKWNRTADLEYENV